MTAFRIATVALLIVILGVLILPRVEDLRHPGNAPTTRTQAAQTVAEKKWGKVCGGQPVVIVRGKVDTQQRLAIASYEFPAGSSDNAEDYFNCRVVFRGGRIPTPVFCTGIVHEFGHLAGYRARRNAYTYVDRDGKTQTDILHSNNPRSVMHPTQQSTWPGCGTVRARPRARAATYGHSASARPTPTIVLIHGGGWQSGAPADMKVWTRDFAAHNMRTVAVTYPFGDVKRAIDDVERQVAVMPHPVIAYGISAGGTIAAALAARGTVDGAVNIAGPTNFTNWLSPGGLYIMGQLRMTRAQRHDASPIYMLGANTRPQLLQYGATDPLVEVTQGTSYARAAELIAADQTLQVAPGTHAQDAAQRRAARAWITERWPG